MKQIDTKYNEAVQLIKSAILHNQLEGSQGGKSPAIGGRFRLA